MTRDSLKFGLVANDFFWLPIFFLVANVFSFANVLDPVSASPEHD